MQQAARRAFLHGFGPASAMSVACGLVLVAAAPAAAQRVSGDNRPFGSGGLTTVAPVQGRGWRLDATVASLYDSNILRIGDGFARPAGYSRSDFRITPTISGAVGLPVGRQQFFFGGQFGHDFYLRSGSLNRNRYGAGGGLNWRVGRVCQGSLTGEYINQRALLSEVSQLVNDVQETTAFNGNIDCSPPIGIGFGGSARHSNVRNQNVNRNVFDSRDTALQGYLSYGTPSLGQFQLGGGYTRVDYPRRGIIVRGADGAFGSDTDGLDLYNGRVGYRRSLGTRITLDASASYNNVKSDPQTIYFQVPVAGGVVLVPNDRKGYSGLGFNTVIGYRPSPRLSADFSASRNVTSSPTVGALFVIETSLGADFSYKIGPSLTAGAGGTFDRRVYRGSFASIEEPLARQNDSISRFYGRLTYAPVKLYNIDLEVAHEKRKSNPSIYDFSGTTVQLSLRVHLGRG